MSSLQADAAAPPAPRPLVSWSDARTRAVLWQVAVVALVCTLVAAAAAQAAVNLRLRGIASGFDYLHRAAEFEISRGPLPYASTDSYARALAVGVVNTLRVSVLGIVIAVVLGASIGVARLSNLWVVAAASRVYVEVLRNTPLLLQLLFWYALSQALPGPRDAWQPGPGVFLCFRGLFLPGLVWHGGELPLGAALVVLAVLIPLIRARSRRRWELSGRGLPTARLLAGAAAVLVAAALVIGRPTITLERPVLAGFDFHGGLSISPEFAALLIGLSTCTAAFIAEIVRGGILSVNRGQTEAAAALGLSRSDTLRLVVLPQALRSIVPPMTSQFLNLAKNSSLAVAIGYPDVVSISNTTLNQTGQAIEAITLVMIVYLAIGLAISLAMNAGESLCVPPAHGAGGR